MSRKKAKPATACTRVAKNFETLLRAAADGSLCLMECQRVDTGEAVAVVCAVNRRHNLVTGEVDEVAMVPFAIMLEGNPYAMLNPPNPEGGFFDGPGEPLEARPA